VAWFFISLVTAFSVASHDAWVKRHFSDLTPFEMYAYPAFYSLPLFLATICLTPVPPLDAQFLWSFLASIPINGISILLVMKALKLSPLSLTLPFLAFTPVFMIATGFIFLGEIPSNWGLFGIGIICTGGYILNIDPRQQKWSDPFRAVLNETGSWMMLIVAFIYSFGAVIGKKGILHSSPVFFMVSFTTAFNLFMLTTLYFLGKIRVSVLLKKPGSGIIAALFLYSHIFSHGWAISMTQASYMISVKRLSVLFGVLYGKFVFKEGNITFRFSGAVLMLIGTLLIVFRGNPV
jgi:drug/metabolite transporter (DMT)-like permease